MTPTFDLAGWARRLRRVDDLGNKFVDFRRLTIPYIAKSDGTAAGFGASYADYAFWRPHVCALCCVKSIGDAIGATIDTTLFDLIKLSVQLEVYRFDDDGNVLGAFHYPLRELFRTRIGVPATVATLLPVAEIKRQLAEGKVVLLSVDLRKSYHRRAPVTHFVTVYAYNAERETFTLHDSSAAIVANGDAAELPASYIDAISNHRGLIIG